MECPFKRPQLILEWKPFQKPFLCPSQGQEVLSDLHFQITVLKNPSLATVGHLVIMPTHRLNDTDSLQQMLPFHGQKPSPHHHHQNSQLIPLSKPLVGRNLLKGDLRRRVWYSLFSLHTFWECIKFYNFEKRLNFLLLRGKYARVKCQISSLFRFISEFIMFWEKEWLLMAERSYYVVELRHSHFPWLFLLAWVG